MLIITILHTSLHRHVRSHFLILHNPCLVTTCSTVSISHDYHDCINCSCVNFSYRFIITLIFYCLSLFDRDFAYL